MADDFLVFLIIGIDHDTVCAGVVGTAIQHSTSCAGCGAAAPASTTSAVLDCSTIHDSADHISGQFLFYHDHNFTKSKGNLRFWRLVPLFVPISVCVTTHDDGTASDVTILFWSRVPDGYRKNDRKRAIVVWPWLVLELSTVLALTQLGIQQSDWWRAGIRSTNLHIVGECIFLNANHGVFINFYWSLFLMTQLTIIRHWFI